LGLREDVTTLGASAGAATLVGLSVFYNSPIFGVLFGVVLGTLVTDFTQSRAQKRAIKRELALQNVNTIYAPIYKEIGSIQEKADNFSYRTGYGLFDTQEWTRVKSEPYYQFIPTKLQQQLDAFYGLVSKFNEVWHQTYNVVRDMVLAEASKFYLPADTDLSFPIVNLSYCAKENEQLINQISIENSLFFGVHPREILKSIYSDRVKLKFYINYSAKKPGGGQYGNDLREEADLKRFDQLYERLMGEFRKMPLVEEFSKILGAVRGSCPTTRNSVLAMIKEPWLT
jgi:hypothetical protein